jgi:hypothetical protein
MLIRMDIDPAVGRGKRPSKSDFTKSDFAKSDFAKSDFAKSVPCHRDAVYWAGSSNHLTGRRTSIIMTGFLKII